MENDIYAKHNVTDNQSKSHPQNLAENDKYFLFENPLKDITQNDVLQGVANRIKKVHGAVYMIAKYIPNEDPLHYGVKTTASSLLDLVFVKDIINPDKCSVLFVQCVVYIDKLIAQIETASVVGYVTMMNRSVMVQVLNDIRKTLTSYSLQTMQASTNAPYVPDSVAYFTLPKDLTIKGPAETYYESKTTNANVAYNHIRQQVPVKDIKLNDTKVVAEKKEKVSFENPEKATFLNSRQQLVIALFRNKNSVTINDITTEIQGVSEKTIQRDLMDLIQKQQIERQGNKRWSTYKLASST